MESSEKCTPEPGNERRHVFDVYDDPVMKTAIDVLERLGSINELTLRAKGLAIPNAVAVANIITESIMKGTSEVGNIVVDSESIKEMGRVRSTIEITIVKKT